MYLEDFSSLNPKERLQIYRNFEKDINALFENCSERKKIVVQLLIIHRTVNTYKGIFASRDKELHMIFQGSVDMLWDYVLGECSQEEFTAFAKGLSAYYEHLCDFFDRYVFQAYPAFAETYHCEDSDCFLEYDDLSLLVGDMDYLCTEIREHNMQFRGIGNDYLLYELAEMAAFAEKIDIGHPEYYQYHEHEARNEAICQTASFTNIMRRISEDIRAALEADENDNHLLSELREQYQHQFFFEQTQFAWLYKYFLY